VLRETHLKLLNAAFCALSFNVLGQNRTCQKIENKQSSLGYGHMTTYHFVHLLLIDMMGYCDQGQL